MTLREIHKAVIEALKANADALGVVEENINGGKPGQMPTEAPFLLLFSKPEKPGESEKLGSARFAKLMLFAGVENPDLDEGIFQSLELAEKAFNVAKKAVNVREVDFDYDSLYDGYCVSFAEFSVSYKLSV